MSHQDNEKNKRLRETIKSLPPMTRDTAERARAVMQDFKVGDKVFLRGEVIEVVEPKNRGIGVRVQFGERFRMPGWCDASVLTSETQVQAEAPVYKFGLQCSEYAHKLGFDVGDGDWQDVSEVVIGLLRAGGGRREAKARERLAAWMVERSFSTGHGDTFEDLLKELDWQVKELRGARAATIEEIACFAETHYCIIDENSLSGYKVCERTKHPNEPFARAIRGIAGVMNQAALAQALQLEEKEGT